MGRPMLSRVQSILRRSLVEIAYGLAWKLGSRTTSSKAAQRAIFTRVYATNEWGDEESRSGPGSTVARGTSLRAALADVIERHSVSTVLDAPCGDFNWMRHITPALSVTYVGADIVDAVIARNREEYADERHRFVCADLTRDPLPRADLILCRDALVHLSFADIWAAISNFRRSGSRLLLATTFADLPDNADTRTGGWRPLNLRAAPFFFPEPMATIDDIPSGGAFPGKRLCLWSLDSLPFVPDDSPERHRAR